MMWTIHKQWQRAVVTNVRSWLFVSCKERASLYFKLVVSFHTDWLPDHGFVEYDIRTPFGFPLLTPLQSRVNVTIGHVSLVVYTVLDAEYFCLNNCIALSFRIIGTTGLQILDRRVLTDDHNEYMTIRCTWIATTIIRRMLACSPKPSPKTSCWIVWNHHGAFDSDDCFFQSCL